VFYGYVVVLACFLFQGVGIGSYIAFGVFFNPLLTEFGWSRATVSGAASLAHLLMGALGVLMGTLNDRFGPRIIMLVTGVIYGSGYFLFSRVDSVWELYLFYGVMVGVGLSSIDVIALTTTARWFDRRRGTMTGFVKAGSGAGQLIMPLTASLLILHFGWRNASWGVGLIALILIVGSGLLLRRDPGRMGLHADGDNGHRKAQAGGKTGAGLSGREAFRTWSLYAVCSMNFLVVGCLMTIMVHIVPHARDSGLEPIQAAGVLSTIGGVSMAGRLLTGLAIDRFGNRRSILVCFGILLFSLLWLRTAGEPWTLYFFAAIYGLAHGGFYTLISPVVAGLFGIGSHGLLIGIVAFTGAAGGAMGPVLAGYMFDQTQSYQPVFLLLIGAVLAGLALTPFLKFADRGRLSR